MSEIQSAITALATCRSALGESVYQTALQALRRQEHLLRAQSAAAERKQVTVMFADISGFTAMSETLDPEDVRSLINACFELLGAVINRYDGYIDKFIGDEIMALFGAPIAHENDPERALRAALDMMAALQTFNSQYRNRLPRPLALHFGINTGLVIAGGIGTAARQDYSVMGDTVNLAARLEGLSESGQILVGQNTYRFAAPFFEFKTLEPVSVKGKAKPVQVHRLLKAKVAMAGQARGLKGLASPLVGRNEELAQLKGALKRLQAGQGSLISLIGEAGLGKTRLMADLKAAAPELEIQWASGRGLSYGENAGYLVARRLFFNLMNIPLEATPVEVEKILQTELRRIFPANLRPEPVARDQRQKTGDAPENAATDAEALSFLDVYPYLAHLLNAPLTDKAAQRVKHLSGEALNRRVLQSAAAYIAAIAQRAPLVLAFDDLHWADPSSLELIQQLTALTRRSPLLILLLYRPPRPQSRIREFHAQLNQLPNKAHRVIHLSPLTQKESTQLVENLLLRCDEVSKICKLVVAKTEGNPFYVEEVIRALIDDKVLQPKAGPGWTINARIDDIAIPDTLQGVIMARVDHLTPKQKRLLQVAAVIGRNFDEKLLAQVMDTGSLQQLQALDLITLKKSEPDRRYAFKHIFTQESVYKSLLRRDRRLLHQQIGQALEAQHSDDLDDIALLLAHHFSRSDDRPAAGKYLLIAAQRAQSTYANQEAKELYTRALALLEKDRYEQRWQLLYRREQILDRLAEREQQITDLTLLQTLAEMIGDDEKLALSHNRRARYFDKISEYHSAAKAAQAGLRAARQANNRRIEAQSLNLLAQAAWRRFDYPAVQKWALQALQALQIVGDTPERITGLLLMGRADYRLGQYDAALEHIQSVMELTVNAEDKDGEARSQLILGWIYQRLGNYAAAAEHFKRKLKIRQTIGDRYGEAEALSHLGWVCYDQEDYARGKDYCLRAIDISRQIGDRENEAYALTSLGLVYEGLGDAQQAKTMYQQALNIHTAINAQTLAMFDLSRLAKLLLDAGNAKAAYRRAQALIDWIKNGGAQQFWDPWLIYYVVYQILQANGKDAAAQRLLDEAYALLQTRARQISNAALRTCFLQDVKVNRLIVEAQKPAGA